MIPATVEQTTLYWGGFVKFIRAGSFFAVTLLCWSSASSQPPQQIAAGDEICDRNMILEPPIASDAEILVELVGLPNISKLNAQRLSIRRKPGLKNACALPEANGYATIAYDPVWAAGDTAAFYLALGHEAGHHFCGHFVGDTRGTWSQKELEADQFGGAAIKRFEIYHNRSFFSQVYATAASKYPEQGPITHPPRASRLAALKLGYELGSPCGGLAPVEQSGYSPGVRAPGPAKPCRPVQTGPTSYACER
jgi:hypothetical protein